MGEDKWNGAVESSDPVGKQNKPEWASILDEPTEEHPQPHVS